MGSPGLQRPERRFGAGADDDDASRGVEVGAALDGVAERELARNGRGDRGKAGRGVVGVDDDGVARTLVADDRLLGGSVAGQIAV